MPHDTFGCVTTIYEVSILDTTCTPGTVRRLACLALLAAAALLLPPGLPAQQAAVGHWRGYWTRSGDTLAVTVAIRAGEAPGRLRATFSSERLRVEDIPFSSAEIVGCCRIRLELRGDETTSTFAGVVRSNTIEGTFTEGNAEGYFRLRREDWRAPGLRQQEVHFANGPVRLSGTLFLPATAPPYPAIVMVHGSGPEGRWANAYLAHRLAAAGMAALTFDKRGVGGSSGDWRTAGFEQLAGDAAAAVALLRRRKDIRREHIGVYGHSQGGTLLPLIAEGAPDVAFFIASAPSGVPTDSTERFSLRNAIGMRALAPAEAAAAEAYVDALVTVAYRGAPRARLDSLTGALAGRSWYFPPPAPGDHYWTFSRRIADFEPRTHWSRVRAPVLLVFGERDERIPVVPSIDAIRAALAAGQRSAPVVCVYAAADHTLRLHPPGAVWPRNPAGYPDDVIRWAGEAARPGRPPPGASRLSPACRGE